MRLSALAAALALAIGVCLAPAEDADESGGASAQPAPTAETKPAPTTAPAGPSAEEVLKALEEAGGKYSTVRADLKYQVENRLLGDRSSRSGWVAYQKGLKDDPPMLRIHFATLRLDEGSEFEEKIDYAFDGKRLSVARHKLKHIQRYRIPKEKRQEPMKLGEGPFPMPFGQKADEVLKHFTATARPAKDGEPKDTDHLELIPRGESAQDLNIVGIEMWVGRDTHLPTRIVSTSRDMNVTTVDLAELKTDVELEEAVFSIPKPSGWRESIENLESGTNLSP